MMRLDLRGNHTMILCRAAGVTALVLIASGCASSRGVARLPECDEPNQQLGAALGRLETTTADGCRNDKIGMPSCAEIKREIERLAVVCPDHAPTLMATALIAFEAGQSGRAQQLLDQIFERPRSYPLAGVLRTRIAIEDGNLPFARRFVEDQVRRTPDHAGLREVQSAVLYLSGQFDEARRALAAAESLGAPAWRVAYHTGLLEEAAGRREAALKAYAEAMEKNPSWPPAVSRFNALKVSAP
jgi:predicted Zn-dependent protease